MFSVSAATSASRIVFCWYRKPGLVPGSTSNQVPHSSTTRPSFFSGQTRRMMRPWFSTISSMRIAWRSASYSSQRLNSVALPLCCQSPSFSVSV